MLGSVEAATVWLGVLLGVSEVLPNQDWCPVGGRYAFVALGSFFGFGVVGLGTYHQA